MSTATACATWRSELRRGHFSESCQLTADLNDRLHRAALTRISREYTASTSIEATVAIETNAPTVPDWRIVTVDGPAAAQLRAVLDDDSVWLPARPADVRAALVLAAGLELSERPSPVRQKIADTTDRKVRRYSAGTVDPRLRKQSFGAVPTCPEGMADCKRRREAFRTLEAMFASVDCDGAPNCERHYVVQRRSEALAEPSARVTLDWDIEGCAVSHTVDLPLGVPADSDTLGGDWMSVSPALTACTLEHFAQPGCSATFDHD